MQAACLQVAELNSARAAGRLRRRQERSVRLMSENGGVSLAWALCTFLRLIFPVGRKAYHRGRQGTQSNAAEVMSASRSVFFPRVRILDVRFIEIRNRRAAQQSQRPLHIGAQNLNGLLDSIVSARCQSVSVGSANEHGA